MPQQFAQGSPSTGNMEDMEPRTSPAPHNSKVCHRNLLA